VWQAAPPAVKVEIMGSPAYMSPEQIADFDTVDGRADVWSLGAILYELLTGSRINDDESVGVLLAMVRHCDLDTRQVVPNLELSASREIRLPLLWIAVLFGKLRAGLAATTGVHSALEIVKYVMAGADAVMTTSALLSHGIPFIGTLVADLGRWMEEREYTSVTQMRGSMSQQRVADPTAFQRANYIRILEGYRPPGG